MTTDFINAFRRLQVHERGQALQNLTTELSPYEWRALHATTSSRTFQLDVIGSLPLELVTQIFCHLDPATPYRLQSVSRRWNDTLRNLHVLKASLNQWYQGTVNLQNTDYTQCKKKARNIHAVRTGKPSHVYKIRLDGGIFDPRLTSNNLIWLHGPYDGQPPRFAYVLDLDQWDLRVLGGQARESIKHVFASSEIVVLATLANICYVYELRGKRDCKSFRVPNINYFKNVACRGRTVACVASLDNRTSVYIWEYDSHRGRSFEIKYEPGTIFLDSDPERSNSRVIAPLIQPKTQTIIIFTDASRATTCPHDQRYFAFSRYTYSGECISTHHPSLPGISDILPWRVINNLVSVDYKESVFAIHIQEQSGTDISSSILLLFNEEDNDLSVWQGSKLHDKEGYHHNGGSMALWRDTCYGALWDEGAEQSDMIAHMGTSDARRYMPIVSKVNNMFGAAIRRDTHPPIMMNEKYVVRTELDKLYLLCFNDGDKGKWPKKSGSFFDKGELELLKTTEI